MAKKIVKPLENFDRRTNPEIVRQAEENARRKIEIETAKKAEFEQKSRK
ncbi:hypothetical protein [Sessilibacter sp. MAH4]